jgi:hypothetical protein
VSSINFSQKTIFKIIKTVLQRLRGPWQVAWDGVASVSIEAYRTCVALRCDILPIAAKMQRAFLWLNQA